MVRVNPTVIGEALRAAREQAGLSETEVAEQLGVSVGTLSRMETGEALKAAREQAGLSQSNLAKELGVSIRTISRWETGEVEPKTREQREKLATTLSGGLGAAAAAITMPVLAPFIGAGVAVAAGLGAKRVADRERSQSVLTQALHAAAEELDVSARRLRSAVERLLRTAEGEGLTLSQMREMIAPAEGTPPAPTEAPQSTR